ncbi:hypothetical protein PN499_08425, partial [Kamptonema animale CS-326]|uniref:hypothetical protein n=1 Tax=Kamptonema animale TaxID=92934 RepID=UPI00232AF604
GGDGGDRGNFPVNSQQLTLNSQQLTLNSQQSQLIEAQGWVIASNGEVQLVAEAPNGEPHGSGLMPPTCRSR